MVIAEQDRDRVDDLRRSQAHAVLGDASDPVVLVQAHVARARVLIVTAHEAFKVRKMIEIARALKPDIRVIVRASSEDEAKLLRNAHAHAAIVAETELARALSDDALHALSRDAIRTSASRAS